MHNRVPYPVHAPATSGGTMVSVMSMGGRRPSTDVMFPRRDYYSKPPPAVNLVSKTNGTDRGLQWRNSTQAIYCFHDINNVNFYF